MWAEGPRSPGMSQWAVQLTHGDTDSRAADSDCAGPSDVGRGQSGARTPHGQPYPEEVAGPIRGSGSSLKVRLSGPRAPGTGTSDRGRTRSALRWMTREAFDHWGSLCRRAVVGAGLGPSSIEEALRARGVFGVRMEARSERTGKDRFLTLGWPNGKKYALAFLLLQ